MYFKNVYDAMVAGQYYYMVLNYVDEYVKRHTPSKFTDLTVKRAEKNAF